MIAKQPLQTTPENVLNILRTGLPNKPQEPLRIVRIGNYYPNNTWFEKFVNWLLRRPVRKPAKFYHEWPLVKGKSIFRIKRRKGDENSKRYKHWIIRQTLIHQHDPKSIDRWLQIRGAWRLNWHCDIVVVTNYQLSRKGMMVEFIELSFGKKCNMLYSNFIQVYTRMKKQPKSYGECKNAEIAWLEREEQLRLKWIRRKNAKDT